MFICKNHLYFLAHWCFNGRNCNSDFHPQKPYLGKPEIEHDPKSLLFTVPWVMTQSPFLNSTLNRETTYKLALLRWHWGHVFLGLSKANVSFAFLRSIFQFYSYFTSSSLLFPSHSPFIISSFVHCSCACQWLVLIIECPILPCNSLTSNTISKATALVKILVSNWNCICMISFTFSKILPWNIKGLVIRIISDSLWAGKKFHGETHYISKSQNKYLKENVNQKPCASPENTELEVYDSFWLSILIIYLRGYYNLVISNIER